jgi:hypothetical protein
MSAPGWLLLHLLVSPGLTTHLGAPAVVVLDVPPGLVAGAGWRGVVLGPHVSVPPGALSGPREVSASLSPTLDLWLRMVGSAVVVVLIALVAAAELRAHTPGRRS